MGQLCRLTALVVAVAAVVTATSPLVALRVEVLPASASDAGGAVLVVQVAPEDRARVGRQAWIEARLERDGEEVGKLSRSAELDRNGLVQFDVNWPPGAFELRVDLESGDRRHSGFWRGPVTVPAPGPRVVGAPPATTPAAAPPAPAPFPATPAPAAEAEPMMAPTPVVAAPTAAPAASPPAVAPGAPSPPAATPAPQNPPSETPPRADALTAWTAVTRGLELTAIVTAAGRPVPDLAAHDLELEIGGERRSILALGDARTAPLELTLIVDLSPVAADDLEQVARELGRLAVRADGGRGHVRVLNSTGSVALDWGGPPARVAEVVEDAGAAASGDLARALRDALEGLADRPGRRAVVVVTDGRRDSDRDLWRAATEAAERAGAPLLVAGLWSADFDAGVRRRLRDLVEVAGGRLFLVHGADQLAATLEEYGLLADSAVSLRFAPAAGEVRLRSSRADLELRHPRALR